MSRNNEYVKCPGEDIFFVLSVLGEGMKYGKAAYTDKYRKCFGENMNILSFISVLMIPLLTLYIIGYGLLRKKDCYEIFVRGAKEGVHTAMEILPTLIGLMTAVSVLRSSGFLEAFSEKLGIFTAYIGLPAQLVPLCVVRLFSNSAAVGLLTDLYARYGTDSVIGYTASLIMCCTETLFYTMSLYLMHVGIRKSRFVLPGAMISILAGITASIWLGRML